MRTETQKQVEFEESSGSIFTDLELIGSAELYTRAEIGVHLLQILKERGLNQSEIADVLGVSKTAASYLMRGVFH